MFRISPRLLGKTKSVITGTNAEITRYANHLLFDDDLAIKNDFKRQEKENERKQNNVFTSLENLQETVLLMRIADKAVSVESDVKENKRKTKLPFYYFGSGRNTKHS